ncbi:MAG: Na/Pi cotransporter family protein [Pseudomonadota bacterium]
MFRCCYIGRAVVAGLFFAPVAAVQAAPSVEPVASIPGGWMVVGLLGGLALFIYGMDHLAGALKVLAGARLRLALGKMTRNRFVGALSGAGITALLQSSSVTTVLVVGFVSAGLMTLPQSIAVIMGANVGSTLTAQIIAFKIEAIAPLMIALGFGVMFFTRVERWSQIGRAVLGLGLLFFGMGMMSEAMAPLRSYPPFIELMTQMSQPLLAIAVAAIFTALVQSSAATTGIVIVLAGQQLVSLDAGIALIFGANIGTCFTALLATIGKNRDALRTAMAHVIFNVVGVLIWLPFIPELAEFVRDISPDAGASISEIPRQIANAHSIFNIANVVLMIGLVPWIARGIEKILPSRDVADPPLDPTPRYLDVGVLETPAVALALVRQEVLHMADIVFDIARRGRQAIIHPKTARLDDLAGLDDGVDTLVDAIVGYAARLRQHELSPQDQVRLRELVGIGNHLEVVGDIVSEELADLLGRMTRLGREPDSEITDSLVTLFRDAETALHTAVSAIVEEDTQKAQGIIDGKASFVNRLELVRQRIGDNVGMTEADIRLYRLELSVIERIDRLFVRARRIANAVMRMATPVTIDQPAGIDPAETPSS